MGVFVGVFVDVLVNVGVLLGVKVGVLDGVFVAGWKGVNVLVGVSVTLGVSEMVAVRMFGVPLTVAVAGVMLPVEVVVNVGVEVAFSGLGAKERQTNPAQ